MNGVEKEPVVDARVRPVMVNPLKDLPKDAARFLDSAVRLLRKKGVGVILVS